MYILNVAILLYTKRVYASLRNENFALMKLFRTIISKEKRTLIVW